VARYWDTKRSKFVGYQLESSSHVGNLGDNFSSPASGVSVFLASNCVIS
jgi:hypothetical protein